MIYEITMTQRTITAWPWPQNSHPRWSRFRAKWSDTSSLLKREVARRGAEDAILEIDVGHHDLRRDGWLRPNARPRSSRVVVTFEDETHGWVRYHCDEFSEWKDNVRAIATSLEALRKVDRYGVSDGEQYHGFRSGRALPGNVLTSREAAVLISANGDDPEDFLHDPEACRIGVRRALKRSHPDHGGTSEDLYVVQAARDVLGQHHGVEI